MIPKLITGRWLNKEKACPEQIVLFGAEWPHGAESTEANLLRAVELGLDLSWLSKHLPRPLFAEYERQRAPLWAAYERQEAPLFAEFQRQRAPLFAEYDRQVAPLWAAYERQRALIRAEYERQEALLLARLLPQDKGGEGRATLDNV